MKRVLAKSILALATGAGLFAVPATAKADHRDHGDFFFRIEKRTAIVIGCGWSRFTRNG
jgi:hypothetical protein